MTKELDIIIINYFSKSKIERLLKSIKESSLNYNLLNVIIINNSSEEEFKDITNQAEVLVINNAINKGFGYACNQAIPFLKSSFCLLLNPDTIVFDNTLTESIEYLKQNNEITALGVKHFNEHNKIVPSCSRFPSLRTFIYDSLLLSKVFPHVFKPLFLMKDWDHNQSNFVDQVMGAYIMIRKSFIEIHGLMDERYFVFLEDMDFCKKVWDNGGKVFYNTNITLIHEGASSTEGVSDKKIAFLMQGKLKYAYKHFPLWKYFFTFVIVAFIEPVFRLFYTALIKRLSVKDVVKGYALFIKRHQFK